MSHAHYQNLIDAIKKSEDNFSLLYNEGVKKGLTLRVRYDYADPGSYQDEDDFDQLHGRATLFFENEPEEELAEWMFLMRYDLDYPNEPPKFGHHEFNVLEEAERPYNQEAWIRCGTR